MISVNDEYGGMRRARIGEGHGEGDSAGKQAPTQPLDGATRFFSDRDCFLLYQTSPRGSQSVRATGWEVRAT